VPEWADYAMFCAEYERGLRREAFVILERFLFSLERAAFTQRRRFVSWLLDRAEGREGRHMLIPHPLHLRVVEPTLLEWTQVEPECSEPHRWIGGYEHLRRAIELQPEDELARKKLIACVLSRVVFGTHVLPSGYLGDARKDLAKLTEAEDLLSGISNDEERRQFASTIGEERALINEYLRGK